MNICKTTVGGWSNELEVLESLEKSWTALLVARTNRHKVSNSNLLDL